MQAERATPRVRLAWLSRATISGFSGAVAMLFAYLVGYGVAYAIAVLPLAEGQPAGLLRGWSYGLTHNVLTDLAGSHVYILAGLHFFLALTWAILYARYAEPRLPGPGWRRGLTFALVPWVVSVLVVLPLGGGGLLGLGLGAGPLPVVGNLILHLAYGAVLGAVYGPVGDLPPDSFRRRGSADDAETTSRIDTRTAAGLAIGFAVGLLGSIALAELLRAAPGSPVLGIPPAAFILGWTVLGGALGAFVGSFAGLDRAGER